MILLEHVTKLYGTVIGVNDLTASLPQGAYGLVGPNGSGKSTLLNLLTGQLRPTLGRIAVLGQPPWNNARLCQRLGVCPEQDAFYPNITPLEWVRYLLELQGFSGSEASERAEAALEQVGLAETRRRPLGECSRGMRQRAKLAQALAHDPSLLILDEPFAAVDPLGRRRMVELIRRRIAEGKGVVIASHLLHEVEAVTDRFLLICGGRLLASGTAEEVYALLEELPKEVRLRADQPRRLARQLLETELADAVRLTGRDELVVSTDSPGRLYRQLPQLVDRAGVRVFELRAAEGSLQALFDALLRIHRGMKILQPRD
ncbi:MAG TPA: ABC transporter ATP-binding protein [Planctomycetes bacterium]|nr:ABC transporter ATP-binding protein [Planctomycetota bacterium]